MEQVLPHLGTANAVAGYHPMRDEIDPTLILDVIGQAERIAALPWFADRDARMIFRHGRADAPGPWGIAQPPANAPVVAPDVVLVPLVAADRACNRIGHGKGHYDRALAHMREAGPVRTIGLAWDVQIVEEAILPDPWDVPLDAIATPSRWIERITA